MLSLAVLIGALAIEELSELLLACKYETMPMFSGCSFVDIQRELVTGAQCRADYII